MPEPAPRTAPKAESLAPTMIRQLRILGLIEGVSFLLLVGIAMPLKYLAGLPQAVRFVGMAHGLLWVLYVGAAIWTGISLRWPLSHTLRVLVASVLPGGPFFIDGWLRTQERRER
jgi:integral membrane protein